jgi:hypothetical protein
LSAAERNLATVAEAYFHLKPFAITEPSLEGLGLRASRTAASAALEIYRPETELIVKLSIGSLRGWATVVVGLQAMLAGYNFVANYKGFKEGVSEIVTDGRQFSAYFNEHFLSETVKSPKAIYRTERRSKTPGKLLRAARRLDWIEQHRSQLPAKAVAEEKAYITKMLHQAMEDLSEEDQRLVKRYLKTEDKGDQGPDEPRTAIRQDIIAQLPLFVEPEVAEETVPPDYLVRFRLCDFGPDGFATVRSHG